MQNMGNSGSSNIVGGVCAVRKMPQQAIDANPGLGLPEYDWGYKHEEPGQTPIFKSSVFGLVLSDQQRTRRQRTF